MPDLNKKYFSGEKDITAEKGRELVTKGDSEDIIRTLTKLGWEGQLIAAVMIRVSVDGRRAEDGQFSLRGALASEPIRIQAAKLWEKADEDVTLEIDVPPGDLPLLDVQSRASSCETIPAGDQLRFAIASIMRTAARPTGCVSIGGLLKYTSKMQRNVDEAAPNEPTITWPVAATPGEEIGECVYLHVNM